MSSDRVDDVGELVATVRSVVGVEGWVGMHVPDIGPLERRYVDECMESTFVSSVGPFVTRFEEEVAAFVGCSHAVAVSNGTAALQVALALAGVRPGDEVIIPALSFIATANAVSHVGARPVFVDSDPATLGMDPGALERMLESMDSSGDAVVNPRSGRRVAAVVPMHTLGHPLRIAEVVATADRYGLPVVEDAAESLGSRVGDRHTGTFGRLGILSFNGNKIITTGGGGMILTDDPELARRAKHLTTTAKVPHEWDFTHDEVAWNYRMPNLNAALGVAQLERLDEFLAAKRALADRYAAAFASSGIAEFISEPAGTRSNYWLAAIRLSDREPGLRDEVLRALNDAGLQSRPLWNLLSDQAPYIAAERGDLVVAEDLVRRVICVPSSAALGAGR